MVFYPTEPAPSSSLDSATIRGNFNFLDNTIITHASSSAAHNADAITIDVIGSPVVDNVEDFHDNIFSAGTFCRDMITDDGDGTITVSSGSGLIRTWDNDQAPLVSFEWASSSSIAIGDDALTYVYLDYNGGSPVIKTTTNRNDISDNCEVCIGHVYKEAGILTIHTRTGGLNTCDITRRVDRRIKDLRNFERSSGMVVTETGVRNIAITAGEGWRGLDLFTTSAQNTSGSGDTFTYWYRDGGGGWTKVSGSTQIDNTQYDDGDGGLATLGVGRYGVHWVFLCNDSHIDIVYGQGNYKLAEAQNAEVPSGLSDKINKFDIIIAKIIILRDAATFTEIDSAFEIFFPRSEVINHNDLGNIDGGKVDEYYHLEDAEHGALVDGGSADGYHTHPDSGSLDTLDSVCERGAETDVAITVNASGSIFTSLLIPEDLQIGEDLEVDGNTVIDGTIIVYGSGSIITSLLIPEDLQIGEDLEVDGNTVIDGTITVVGSGSIITSLLIPEDLHVGEDIFCDWDVYSGNGLILNSKFANQDVRILFRKAGAGFEFFDWDMTPGIFRISNDLQILGNNLYLGNLTSGSNKVIYANNGFGGDETKPNLRYNESTNKWQFSNDGEAWSDIGSGGAGVQSIEFDVGGLALGDGTAGSAAPALSLLTTSDSATPKCRTFCLRFDDTTNEHCFPKDRMPLNYSSGGRMKVQFYNVGVQADNAKTTQFDAALQAVTPGDATIMTALDLSNDGGGWVGALKTLDAGTTAGRLYELSIDMTSYLDGLAAGDFVQFGFRRNCASGSSTGDMAVITIAFEYNY